MYVYRCTCVYIYTYIIYSVFMSLFTYIHIYIYTYVCIYIYIHMYAQVRVCVHAMGDCKMTDTPMTAEQPKWRITRARDGQTWQIRSVQDGLGTKIDEWRLPKESKLIVQGWRFAPRVRAQLKVTHGILPMILARGVSNSSGRRTAYSNMQRCLRNLLPRRGGRGLLFKTCACESAGGSRGFRHQLARRFRCKGESI